MEVIKKNHLRNNKTAALVLENGEVLFPVSEITVAGNLNKIFSRLIPADDLQFNFGINAPSVLVENMTLGGI